MKSFLLSIFMVVSASNITMAWADPLANPKNLQAEPESRVLLFLFKSEGCPYCEAVRKDVLEPMAGNPAYGDVAFYRIDVGSVQDFVGFDGKTIEMTAFAEKYNRVGLTPVIGIFDRHGNRLAKPIIGYQSPDYYGFYLDEAIAEARAKVHLDGAERR